MRRSRSKKWKKSKSFEPSLTCARDAEILSRKMKGKRPDAAIRYSTLCRGVVQYLTDEFTVRKNKAEKVVTAVSNHARSYKGQTSTPEIINLEKSPDVEIPTPEVTQVAGPAVTDNATPPKAVMVELKAMIDEATKVIQSHTKVIQRSGSVMQIVLDTIEVLTDRT